MNQKVARLEYRLARYKYMDNGVMCQYLSKKIRDLQMQAAHGSC